MQGGGLCVRGGDVQRGQAFAGLAIFPVIQLNGYGLAGEFGSDNLLPFREDAAQSDVFAAEGLA